MIKKNYYIKNLTITDGAKTYKFKNVKLDSIKLSFDIIPEKVVITDVDFQGIWLTKTK
jgi:hypothetical protein